ncbi:MAG: DUF1800 domain-containing protein [Gammaproteobacteria bacterium]|nr:DUF1800 domain-containing protein [Gammaproteobacteria bacterium]
MVVEALRAATSAANRFGLGARPGEIEGIADPRAWLLAQIRRPPDGAEAFVGLPSSLEYLRREARLRREHRRLQHRAVTAASNAARNPFARRFRQTFGDDLRREAVARWQIAATTTTPFTERLVRFWSNHFAVSVDKGPVRLVAAPLEREAIRPHFAGRFADLLLAVETHPAMLRYLDQAQSVGPDSPFARRVDRRLARRAGRRDLPVRSLGLNENLAREILELHTLGANAGYTQADVTEFARALTGWSLPFPAQLARGTIDRAFLYRAAAHEPGSRVVLGRRYPDTGFEQARAILLDLAASRATARHLGFELARHFVADEPPPALVDHLAAAYLDGGGELSVVYAALIDAPAAWSPSARKFRSPQDFLIAALRGGSIVPGARPQPFEGLAARLGEPTFMPRAPAGFSDLAADWIGPDALWKRVQAAEGLAAHVPRAALDPGSLARSVLGSGFDAPTRTAIDRAEAPRQAVAMLFASPAFQWRI